MRKKFQVLITSVLLIFTFSILTFAGCAKAYDKFTLNGSRTEKLESERITTKTTIAKRVANTDILADVLPEDSKPAPKSSAEKKTVKGNTPATFYGRKGSAIMKLASNSPTKTVCGLLFGCKVMK